jgi:hypothetical protein
MIMNTVKTVAILACMALLVGAMLGGLNASPVRAEGVSKPGTIVLKYLVNQYGPVTFNHEMHVAIAGNCGTCHHQHDEKVKAGCTECHALNAGAFKPSAKKGFAACSSCHSDPMPDMPEMPGLKVAFHKKCFSCHVGMNDLGSSPEACTKTCLAKKK